ncbi:trifunctional hydroxymethylpyrimidine kinase/phosphomethylpyrimidine kinase/thiaminase [Dipsacomyces acuminosporus]|nr:trifunctional hydroxymethylpyrimidine kinase/phosphomethylpyrimidine kinase/thiaminase [Dipsacomyces acuminosporus]
MALQKQDNIPGPESLPAVLTIAGSDSGGGAGIQADLKTFMAHQTYGTSVITALTAQNTQEVRGVMAVPAPMVEQQLDAVMDDIDVRAAKVGMLSNASIIKAVASAWERSASKRNLPLVVDPVMVATSGGRLLDAEAIDTLRDALLPLSTVVTPNLREAEVILDMEPGSIKSLKAMDEAARKISAAFAIPVTVVKGGHLDAAAAADDGIKDEQGMPVVVDVVYQSEGDCLTHVKSPRIESSSTHGTGCTLSAAIAANLAKGMVQLAAIQAAVKYVNEAIQAAFAVGSGHGPVNHSYALRAVPILRPTKYNPHPFTQYLKDQIGGLWDQYIAHPFVVKAGDGTLSRESFLYYLKQDYIYLKHYARTNALAAFKSDSLHGIGEMADIALGCARESELHVKLCGQWGISREEMESEQESWASVAYTRYIIDKGTSGDLLDLLVAMYPCLLGYGEAAARQAGDSRTVRQGNPYWPWIENYADRHFLTAVDNGRLMIEKLVQREAPSADRLARLVKTFADTTALEVKFWDSALELGSS